ncbi:hypothetical protein A3Q56_08289, partial [Intoshia linei]
MQILHFEGKSNIEIDNPPPVQSYLLESVDISVTDVQDGKIENDTSTTPILFRLLYSFLSFKLRRKISKVHITPQNHYYTTV